MAEKVDVYKLIVEVEGANTIGQLEQGLKTLREELKNKDIGSKEFEDLSKSIQDTELQLQAVGKTASSAGDGIGAAFGSAAQGITSGFQSALGAMSIFSNGSDEALQSLVKLQGLMQLKEGVGGLKNAIVQMTGFNKVLAGGIKGVNGLKVAFAALGIGAIIAVITTLVAAFAKLDSMMEKLEVVLGAIKGGFDAVLDTLALLGSALIKLFSGDFKGAAEDATNAIAGFNDRLVEGVKVGAEVAKMNQKLEDSEIALIETQAKLKRSIAENRELMSDENATIAEKINALNQARQVSEEYYNNEIRLAKDRLKILKLEASTAVEMSDGQRRAIAEASAALDELEASRAKEQRTLNREEKRISAERDQRNREAFEKRKAAIEENIKYELDRLTLLGQLTYEKELEFLNKRLTAKLITQKAYENELLKLQLEYQKKAEDAKIAQSKIDDELNKEIAALEKENLEDELAANKRYLTQRNTDLLNQLAQNQITETEFKDMADAEKMLALEEELAILELHGQDTADVLLKQAELEVSINKNKNEQLMADDEALYNARVGLAQAGADIMGSLTQLLADEQGKQSAVAKAAALAQLGIETAMAFVDGLRIAQRTALTSPAPGLTFAAFYASQVASILSVVNKAKGILGGGGSGSPSVGQSSSPNLSVEPQTVRSIQSTQTFRSYVLVKDINGAQQTLDVVDGNSFVIK